MKVVRSGPAYARNSGARTVDDVAWNALFRACAEADALVEPERFLAITDEIVARTRADRRAHWNVLEPSLSVRADGVVERSRFAYAFPRHLKEPARVAREFVAMAGLLGDALAAAAERVACTARHPSVAQPLFGLAVDGGTSLRAKLYVQFRDGQSDAARLIAARLLALDPTTIPYGPLHLLGLDLSERGRLVGAKLYYQGPVGSALAAVLSPWTPADVLSIHRIVDPSSPVPCASEVDFAVGSHSVAWESVRARVPALSPMDSLARDFPVLVRRVSLDPRGKATAYYALS